MCSYLLQFKVALEPSETVAAIAHRFELSQVQLGTSLRFKSQMDGKSAREKESSQRVLRIMRSRHIANTLFVGSFVLCAHATRAENEKSQAAIKPIKSNFINKENKESRYFVVNYISNS